MTTAATDSDILDSAGRIAAYGESILEAHSFGHGPGHADELWSRSYHEAVLPIYPQTIPWSYLTNLADHFLAVARHMMTRGSASVDPEDWIIVSEYLRNCGDVLRQAAPPDGQDGPAQPVGNRTPSIMKFELLAEIASSEGADRLRQAGLAVQRSMAELLNENPLSDEEIRLLQHLVAGQNVADLTTELGYSERSLYRKLHLVWDRLGVESRSQGLALVVSKGWLEAS